MKWRTRDCTIFPSSWALVWRVLSLRTLTEHLDPVRRFVVGGSGKGGQLFDTFPSSFIEGEKVFVAIWSGSPWSFQRDGVAHHCVACSTELGCPSVVVFVPVATPVVCISEIIMTHKGCGTRRKPLTRPFSVQQRGAGGCSLDGGKEIKAQGGLVVMGGRSLGATSKGPCCGGLGGCVAGAVKGPQWLPTKCFRVGCEPMGVKGSFALAHTKKCSGKRIRPRVVPREAQRVSGRLCVALLLGL